MLIIARPFPVVKALKGGKSVAKENLKLWKILLTFLLLDFFVYIVFKSVTLEIKMKW